MDNLLHLSDIPVHLFETMFAMDGLSKLSPEVGASQTISIDTTVMIPIEQILFFVPTFVINNLTALGLAIY